MNHSNSITTSHRVALRTSQAIFAVCAPALTLTAAAIVLNQVNVLAPLLKWFWNSEKWSRHVDSLCSSLSKVSGKGLSVRAFAAVVGLFSLAIFTGYLANSHGNVACKLNNIALSNICKEHNKDLDK